MAEYVKQSVLRPELRKKIIETAVKLFSAQGIRSVTMDDIAATLGISKRTLYEVFADKESLLEGCVCRRQEETSEFVRNALSTSGNVLEVILKCYQRSIEKFHSTNRKYFDDLKRYPRVYRVIRNGYFRSSEEAVKLFQLGVEQGLFRADVNFSIISLLVREQIDLMMLTDLCTEYPFFEVYESIVFTFLRGVSTEKGAAELEKFICEYRKKGACQAGNG